MVEYFDVYDAEGNRLGFAPRSQCHGNPALLHRTAHVVIFHPDGERILLQKRTASKDIQPGKWDTAVGGHLAPGETFLSGARRELTEELGVAECPELAFLFDSEIRNGIESENVRVFGATLSGPFDFQRSEIDAVRFWSWTELFDSESEKSFTPNLVAELNLLRRHGFSKW